MNKTDLIAACGMNCGICLAHLRRTRYRMSMTDNLNSIKSHGLEWFAESEDLRWTCRNCGATICVHRENCQECGKMRIDLANRRNVG